MIAYADPYPGFPGWGQSPGWYYFDGTCWYPPGTYPSSTTYSSPAETAATVGYWSYVPPKTEVNYSAPPREPEPEALPVAEPAEPSPFPWVLRGEGAAADASPVFAVAPKARGPPGSFRGRGTTDADRGAGGRAKGFLRKDVEVSKEKGQGRLAETITVRLTAGQYGLVLEAARRYPARPDVFARYMLMRATKRFLRDHGAK